MEPEQKKKTLVSKAAAVEKTATAENEPGFYYPEYGITVVEGPRRDKALEFIKFYLSKREHEVQSYFIEEYRDLSLLKKIRAVKNIKDFMKFFGELGISAKDFIRVYYQCYYPSIRLINDKNVEMSLVLATVVYFQHFKTAVFTCD